MSVQHIFSGSGAPTIVPIGICAHYLDTLNGRLYISKGSTSAGDWIALDGLNGIDGESGADGASAYQLAVQAGFVGTQEQWMHSLLFRQVVTIPVADPDYVPASPPAGVVLSAPVVDQTHISKFVILDEWDYEDPVTYTLDGTTLSLTINGSSLAAVGDEIVVYNNSSALVSVSAGGGTVRYATASGTGAITVGGAATIKLISKVSDAVYTWLVHGDITDPNEPAVEELQLQLNDLKVYDIGGTWNGVITNPNQVVTRFSITRAITFPANFTGSRGRCDPLKAATADASFSIMLVTGDNAPSQIGIMTFNQNQTRPVFESVDGIEFTAQPDDQLIIIGPTTPDVTLGDISWTISARRV